MWSFQALLYIYMLYYSVICLEIGNIQPRNSYIYMDIKYDPHVIWWTQNICYILHHYICMDVDIYFRLSCRTGGTCARCIFVSCLTAYCRRNRYLKDLLTYIGRKWISYKIYFFSSFSFLSSYVFMVKLKWEREFRTHFKVVITIRSFVFFFGFLDFCTFVTVLNPFWFLC